MFTKPTDTNKSAIFSVLVLLMALVRDFGLLILVGAVIGAVWLDRRLMKGEPRPGVASGRAPAV